MEKEITQIGHFFDIRSSDSELYKLLLTGGESAVGRLAKKVSMSRPAVYDSLERLVEKGIVVQTGEAGVKIFSAKPFTEVQTLLIEKQKEITDTEKALNVLETEQDKLSQFKSPRLQIYEGRESIQQMIKSVLLKRNTTIRAFWPIEKMIEVFTPKFWAEYDARRHALNLDGKVIWPRVSKTFFEKHKHLLPGKELKREIRYVPRGTQFDMGYNICGNTVCFVSSKRENFGFLVESDELAQTLSTQFDLLWETLKSTKSK